MSSSLTSLTSLLHLIALDLTLSSSLITAMSSLVPPLRLASLSPSLVTSSIALAEKLSEFVLVLFGGWIGGAFGLEGFEVNLSDAGEAFLLADFFFLFLFFLVVVSVGGHVNNRFFGSRFLDSKVFPHARTSEKAHKTYKTSRRESELTSVLLDFFEVLAHFFELLVVVQVSEFHVEHQALQALDLSEVRGGVLIKVNRRPSSLKGKTHVDGSGVGWLPSMFAGGTTIEVEAKGVRKSLRSPRRESAKYDAQFFFQHHNNNFVMNQHIEDDAGRTESIDQANMLSVKVSSACLEQATTPYGVVQPQTAAPSQQSHPYALVSGICKDERQEDLGHPQNVDPVNIASTQIRPEVVEQASTYGEAAELPTATPSQHSDPFILLPGLSVSIMTEMIVGGVSESLEMPKDKEPSIPVAAMEVKLEVVDKANISHPPATPSKRSDQSLKQHSPHTPKGNEQAPFSADEGQTSSQKDHLSPTTACTQDEPVQLQDSQDTPKLPYTPTSNPLARPRCIKAGTGEASAARSFSSVKLI
ncbi:hypothetical protein KCU63_g41, partial [Aureobasidium melanogenum]